VKLSLNVNGVARTCEVNPWRRLLDVLREDLHLTGTKEGCGEGECGACTVLIDGKAVNSCLVAAAQAEGHELTTVEGLAEGGQLTDIQDALVRFGGTQCGICTPGIALCATAVLKDEPDPSRERVRELLAGNLCRCTGYQLIVDAIADVVAQRGGGA
jgi:aerobic-type carbon monoxide dehydrogenase small subunit (CoxS/CutS family)